jgi:hypothetical protein
MTAPVNHTCVRKIMCDVGTITQGTPNLIGQLELKSGAKASSESGQVTAKRAVPIRGEFEVQHALHNQIFTENLN